MLMNVDRARRVLARNDLAAVVATRPENVFYLSGFGGVLYPLAGTPPWSAGVLCAEDRPSMVVVSAGALLPLAEEPAWVDEVVGVGRDSLAPAEGDVIDAFTQRLAAVHQAPDAPLDVAAALARGLRARGIAASRVGWDDPAFGREVVDRFDLPGEVMPASEVLREIRAVKTPPEIERLEAALAANEACFRLLFEGDIEGLFWPDLVHGYRTAFVGHGARAMYEAGGIGPRSVASFADGGGPVTAGDPVFFDAGGTLGRYWTDTGRTVFVGEPNARQRAILDAEVAGFAAVRAATRPGVLAAALVAAFRSVIRAHALPGDGWFWGHGLGLELYEWPRIRDGSPDVLEPGMIFNFESPFRAVGLGGVHLEQTFQVTDDGCRCLSTLPDWLQTGASVRI
jgi:Xaa-Pro aminopeptidase